MAVEIRNKIVWCQVASGDIIAPTLSTATIGTDGITWTFVFDETVAIGAGGNGGWAVSMSTQGAITLTYSSGSGSNTLVYTGNKTVLQGETVTAGLDYTQPGNGIEDASGNDLANIDDKAVTNNSEMIDYSDILFHWDCENTYNSTKPIGLTGVPNESPSFDDTNYAVGSYSFTRNAGWECVTFTITNAHFNQTQGQVGFFVRRSGTQSNAFPIMDIQYDTNNRLTVEWDDQGGGNYYLRAKWNGNGTEVITGFATAGPLADLTWYYAVLWFNQAATSGTRLSIALYDTSGVQVGTTGTYTTTQLTAWTNAADTLQIPCVVGVADIIWFDNIVISNSTTRDLVTIRNNTSYS